MPRVSIWSLSHWYMWLPLWLIFIAPGSLILGTVIVNLYKDRRDRKLLQNGVISLNEYRARSHRGIRKS